MIMLAAAARGETPVAEMLPVLADLAARGGYGGQHAERGAFIVLEEDGTVGCRLWPATGQFHRASQRGAIPPRTIAVAHTHPRSLRELSAQDRREAARLGMPVIAVSMGTVHVAESSGEDRPILRGVDWSRHSDPSVRCEEP
jgi:hypothetical protein